MGQIVQTNGDYVVKVGASGNIILDAGDQGEILIKGNLSVTGDVEFINTTNLAIEDNIIELNVGETGSGVTLRYSGLEIDRGSLDPMSLVYDELEKTWQIAARQRITSVYDFSNSSLKLSQIRTDPLTNDGDLNLIGNNPGVVNVGGAENYEERVRLFGPNAIPNKAYVDSLFAATNVIYVTLDGDDSNDGQGIIPSRAKRTLESALAAATRGTCIFVKSGDYTENNPLIVPAGVSIIGDSLRTVFIRSANPQQDLFKVDDAVYLAHMSFKGLRAPAYCVSIRPGALVFKSPYVQNCSNINGPWLNDGTEFVPYETVQNPSIIPTDKPLINPIDVPNFAKRVNINGGGGGLLVDGDQYDSQSLVKSMVADAFTQVNQGGIGFHITNFGYAQLVSCFTVFSSEGFKVTSGGYLSISNSVSDFGTKALVADGYYPIPYLTATVGQTYFSRVASATLLVNGSGYQSVPNVIIDAPTGAGGVQATAVAIVTDGAITSILITNQGSGYEVVPNIVFSGGSPSIAAQAEINLQKNQNLLISNLPEDVQIGSIVIFDNDPTRYYITNKGQLDRVNATVDVTVFPSLLTIQSGTSGSFHNVSTISTSGHAFEYIGAGITYNALPFYGGVPIPENQINETDGGKIFYTTVDEIGNFRVGSFFNVDQLTGSVSISSDNFSLRGISELGPFLRNGAPVGTVAKEISNDPNLISSTGSIDQFTLPTQEAVVNYLNTFYLPLVGGTITSDLSVQGKLSVDDIDIFDDTILNTATDGGIRLTPNGIGTVIVDTDQALQIPVGDISVRPAGVTGQIRFNSDTNQFEGYNGIAWSSLGGVRDVDGNTYIIPELAPGSDENTLYFYTDGNLSATLDSTEFTLSGLSWNNQTLEISTNSISTIANNDDITLDPHGTGSVRITSIVNATSSSTGALIVDGGAGINDDLYIGGNLYVGNDISIIGDFSIDSIRIRDNEIEIIDSANDLILKPNAGGLLIIDSDTALKLPVGDTASKPIGTTGLIRFNTDITQFEGYNGFDWTTLGGVRDVDGDTFIIPEQTTGSDDDTLYFYTGGNLSSTLNSSAFSIFTDTYMQGNLSIGANDSSLPSIDSPATIFNLLNTDVLTINIGGDASSISLGDSFGTTTINHNLNIVGNQLTIGSGDASKSVISSTDSEIDLFNTLSTLINIGGSATTINLGAVTGATTINHDLEVRGGDLTTDQSTFNLVNTVATTVNFAGAATAINLGTNTGTTTVNHNLTVNGSLITLGSGDSSVVVVESSNFEIDLFSTTVTTINFGGDATVIDVGASTGTTTINHDLEIRGGDLTTDQSTFNLLNTTATTVNFAGGATAISMGSMTGATTVNHDFTVLGSLTTLGSGDSSVVVVDSPNAQVNLFDTTVTTVNIGGDATAIDIGANTGTTTINHDLEVRGGDLTTNQGIFNLVNTVATTVNLAGAATIVNIANTTGTTNVRNVLNVDGNSLTTSSGTFNLVNTTATQINFGGAATSVNIGSAASTTTLGQNLVVTGDAQINGGDLTTNLNTFNLLNTTVTTVNFAGAATAVNIGSSTGTTTVNHDFTVLGNQIIGAGDSSTASLATPNAVFDLLNDTVDTINFGGDADFINIGSASSVVDLSNDLILGGDLAVNGGDITSTAVSFNLLNQSTAISALQSATAVSIGSTTGTLTLRNPTIVSSESTISLFNTTATTVNFAGAATTIEIGAATGTTNINNDLDVDGDINIDGGDLTVSTSTFNLVNATATTVNFAGVSTAINTAISAAAASTLTFGPAITNNTFKINSTTSGTVNLSSDVETGIVNLYTAVTTGTVNLATAGASTINIGGAASTANIGTTAGNSILELRGDAANGTITLRTNSGVGTANIFDTEIVTANVAGSATAVNIADDAASAATITLGPTRTGNTVKIQSVSSGTINLTSDVTSGSVNVFTGTTGTINIGGAATIVNLGATTADSVLEVRGNSTSGTSTIRTNSGVTTANVFNTVVTTGNLFGTATTINAATSAGSATTLTLGAANSGNTFKLASTTNGTVNYTTDVTNGTINAWQSVTGTMNIGSSGDINLGTSASAATTMKVGGAITGNTVKIASTSAGTINLSSDVETGIANIFTGITTGTVNVATGGASTLNIGGTGSTVNVKTLTLTTDLEVQYGGTGVGTFTTNGILYGNSTSAIQVTAASDPGNTNATTSYGILTTTDQNVPVWTDVIDGGTY